MTPHGTAAVIILVITNGATAIGALIAVLQWRRGVSKEKHNRLIMMERWADAIMRYVRILRDHLIARARKGMVCPHCKMHIADVIDVSQLDMSLFPPPPLPTINGDS